MSTFIFFAGLMLGFLIGWMGLALLVLAARDQRREDLAYNELPARRPKGPHR